MKKKLAIIGLLLFPVAGLWCLVAFVMLSLGTHSRDFNADRAMRAVYVYRAVLLISVLGIVSSIVVLIKCRK